MWNFEGMVVEGKYMGEIPVKGRVELSRVKYGGRVQHTIALEVPVQVFGQLRERVLVEHEFVTKICG